MVCGATTLANAEPIADRINAVHPDAAFPVEIRVQSAESVDAAVTMVESRAGPIGVLVNNAGISRVIPFQDMDLESFDAVVDVNLRGVFITSQAVVRRALARDGELVIVNVGSIAGVNGFPERAGYASSKAAVHQLTRVMALDLAVHRIRVNCVAPGYIRTDLIEDLARSSRLDIDAVQRRIPMGRLGRGEDIAAAVSWLVGDESAYVTGETIVVDGGWMAYGFT